MPGEDKKNSYDNHLKAMGTGMHPHANMTSDEKDLADRLHQTYSYHKEAMQKPYDVSTEQHLANLHTKYPLADTRPTSQGMQGLRLNGGGLSKDQAAYLSYLKKHYPR